MAEINLLDFFAYYRGGGEGGQPQQEAAVKMLEAALPQDLKQDTSEWVQKYRETPPTPKSQNPLAVPYDCQLNHGDEGWRLCFTASCAMVAKYWLPDLDINEYYARRPRYGDSTDPSAQIRCLQSFGLEARFVQVGSAEKLKAQIDRGRPAPVGYLHHGTPQAPTGGGHYSVAIGYNSEGFVFNDPYGRLNTATGSYPNPGPNGASVVYKYSEWVPRWSVANDHDGWGLDVWLPGK